MNKNISRDSINREDKNKHKEIVLTGKTRKKKPKNKCYCEGGNRRGLVVQGVAAPEFLLVVVYSRLYDYSTSSRLIVTALQIGFTMAVR
jgi:hypothetical protein